MSSNSSRCWRCQRFEPHRNHVSAEALGSFLHPDSPLRRTLEPALASRLPLLLTGSPGRGRRWTARVAHALSGRRGRLLEIERSAGPGGERLRGLLERAGAEDSLSLAGLQESPELCQRELADFLDDRPAAAVMILANETPDPASATGLRRQITDRLFWVRVQPLSDRPVDIEPGLEFFLGREAREQGRSAPELHDLVRMRLRSCTWPGDLAELERFAERAVVLGSLERALAMVEESPTPRFDTSDFWEEACRRLEQGRSVSLDRVCRRLVRQTERAWVGRVLDRVQGDTRRAAELLGVSPGQLDRLTPRAGR